MYVWIFTQLFVSNNMISGHCQFNLKWKDFVAPLEKNILGIVSTRDFLNIFVLLRLYCVNFPIFFSQNSRRHIAKGDDIAVFENKRLTTGEQWNAKYLYCFLLAKLHHIR